MGVKLRLRTIIWICVPTLVCVSVYFSVTNMAASLKSSHRAQKNLTQRFSYINRPKDLSSPTERKSRVDRLQSACAKPAEGSVTMNILTYERKPSLRMSYCVVAKAGCTFWIRIFRFLNNDTWNTHPRTPFDIDRTLAHDGTRRTMKMYRLKNQNDRLFIENSTRFMFARDPYTRVWSAYIDKLILPNLWTTTGKEIVSHRPGASARSLLCGDDVTFQEFVEHIVNQSESKGPESLNGHWRPIQFACDPCQFKPQFVGKQETFMGDTKTILGHFNLQHLLHGYDRDVHLRDEIKILVDFNFDLLHWLPPQCASARLVSQRLWAAFQLNGYLSPFRNVTSVLAEEESPDREAFKRAVYREQEKHWEEIGQAGGVYRKRAVVKAYRELPLDLLHRFVKVYSKDFEYFGYNRHPPDIFESND